MFVGQTVGVLVGSLMYAGDFMKAMTDPVNHPDIGTAILFSQGIGSMVGLIFIPWFYLKASEHKDIRGLFRSEPQWPTLLIAMLIGIMAMATAISPIAEWNNNIQFPEWLSGFGQWAKNTEKLAADIIKSITSNLTPGGFILTFFVVAVIPGIGEELVFRGLIQNEFVRAFKNPHLAIWTTSIIFSAIHLQFFGFVPRILIGAFLGYLYYWSGNLWVPIIAHFINNGLQVIGLYLFSAGSYRVQYRKHRKRAIVGGGHCNNSYLPDPLLS